MVILCHNALYFLIYCDKNRLVGKREFFTKCRILDFFICKVSQKSAIKAV